MADTVRFLLEEMIPELEDLEKRRIFSKGEIRALVKKRTNFEYLLKRRAPLKADYLRYVEFETKVEVLRRHRKRFLGLTEEKNTVSDHSIQRRIHFIYERATRKFKGDLRLWLGYFEFCRQSGSTKSLSKIMTRALQLHPTAAGLWSYAAAWEFEHNRNPDAARTLMQRGLRMCPSSERLWLEYFRMELLYAHKLETRRRVLQLSMASIGADAEATGGAAEDGEGGPEGSGAAVRAGAVAGVVLGKAAEALPGRPSFLLRFLDVLGSFEPGEFGAVRERVCREILEKHPRDEACRARVARWRGEAEGHAHAVLAFEAAIQDVPTADMFLHFFSYLEERITTALAAAGGEGEEEGEGGEGEGRAEPPSEEVKREAQGLADKAHHVAERACARGTLNEEMVVRVPALLARCGEFSEALFFARDVTAVLPKSGVAWEVRMRLECENISNRCPHNTLWVAAQGADRLFAQALLHVPPVESRGLWLLALSYFSALERSGQAVSRFAAHYLLGSGPNRDHEEEVLLWLLPSLMETNGINGARNTYKSWFPRPGCGPALFLAVAELERLWWAAAVPPLDGPVQARLVLEMGLAKFKATSVELWLALYRLERAMAAVGEERGSGRGGAEAVYWRATKELAGDDAVAAFTEQARAMGGV